MGKNEFLSLLDSLGYQIAQNMSFNYRNRLNAEAYDARSICIVEKDTGLSFANIHARRDRDFEALQLLRRTETVVVRGRVWEL